MRFQSPGQRRRAGLESSVHSDVEPVRGGSMAEDGMASGLAGMSGNFREPMGNAAISDIVNASADYTSGAINHPRFSQPVNDPAFFPVARPENVYLGRAGARYGLRVFGGAPVLAEAGPTQANGRVVQNKGTSNAFWSSSAG